MTPVQVSAVQMRQDLREFVRFPWQVYRGDPNWVPPLISERRKYLDPRTGPFYAHAEASLLLARRDGSVVGTIAPFVDRDFVRRSGKTQGGFGFFESVDDPEVAGALLDAACRWLKDRGMSTMRGPTCFTENECPGVLVEPTDCPPAMLEAHTPLYYQHLFERCGMQCAEDLYAYRATREQFGDGCEGLPPQLVRVAEAVRRDARVAVRRMRMRDWDREVGIAHTLFNETLRDVFDRPPVLESEFRRLAGDMKLLIDPDLALIAEVEGRPVGFCVAIPDANRVLLHLNGRLFPFGWLKAKRLMRQIDVVSFKLMGVLPEYRRRGIEALLFVEAIRAVFDKGYAWLDGSVTSAMNPTINKIALRFGAERYKHFRLYEIRL